MVINQSVVSLVNLLRIFNCLSKRKGKVSVKDKRVKGAKRTAMAS